MANCLESGLSSHLLFPSVCSPVNDWFSLGHADRTGPASIYFGYFLVVLGVLRSYGKRIFRAFFFR
jgi:hypothetical protein